jgi:hypothetical protein
VDCGILAAGLTCPGLSAAGDGEHVRARGGSLQPPTAPELTGRAACNAVPSRNGAGDSVHLATSLVQCARYMLSESRLLPRIEDCGMGASCVPPAYLGGCHVRTGDHAVCDHPHLRGSAWPGFGPGSSTHLAQIKFTSLLLTLTAVLCAQLRLCASPRSGRHSRRARIRGLPNTG